MSDKRKKKSLIKESNYFFPSIFLVFGKIRGIIIILGSIHAYASILCHEESLTAVSILLANEIPQERCQVLRFLSGSFWVLEKHCKKSPLY